MAFAGKIAHIHNNRTKSLTFIESLSFVKHKTQLEIWGKAQRESARRPKSDWGKLKRGGSKISPASKSRGPNSNALAYAERALST